jgi:hypothetical protein
MARDTDDDDFEEYESPFQPWQRPGCEADLYLMDLRAEEAQRRADRIMASVQNVALCRKACERTWAEIAKDMPTLRWR